MSVNCWKCWWNVGSVGGGLVKCWWNVGTVGRMLVKCWWNVGGVVVEC